MYVLMSGICSCKVGLGMLAAPCSSLTFGSTGSVLITVSAALLVSVLVPFSVIILLPAASVLLVLVLLSVSLVAVIDNQ